MLPNLWRLSLTVLVVLIVAAGVHGLHVVRQGRSVDLLRQSIEQERKAENPPRLIAAIKRYLLVAPNDTGLRKELLDLECKHARTEEEILDVYYQLQDLLKRQPEDAEHRERMITYALQLGEYQDVLNHIQFLEAMLGKTPQLLMWKATAQHKTADMEGAIQSYRSAIELDPTLTEPYVKLANILRRELNALDESKYWIVKLTESNPRSADAFLAQSRYYLDVLDLQAALESIESALKFPENGTEGTLLWSEIFMAVGEREGFAKLRSWRERDEEVARRLNQAWKEDPNEARFASKLSALSLRNNQPEEAERVLQLGLERAPHNPLLTWELADLKISLGQRDDAQRLISDLVAENVSRGLVEYLRGRIFVTQQRWNEGVSSLLQCLNDIISSPRLYAQANIFLADCYAELGDSDQRLSVSREAVRVQPFFVAARQHLAQALLAVGRVDEALAEYRTMIDLPDAPAFGWTAEVGWAAVAKVLIIRNLSVPKGEANWEEIEPALDALTSAAPNSIEAVLLRAEVLAARSELKEARDVLLKFSKNAAPTDIRWWVALIHLALRESDLEQAEQRLKEAQQTIGTHVELRSLEIKLAVFQGERGRERLSRFANETAGFSPGERARLLYELAGFYVSLGSMPDALALWKEIAVITPHDLRVWLLQFDAAISRRDFDACREVIDGMRQIEGKNGSYTLLSETFLVLHAAMSGEDVTSLESARSVLTSLQVRRPRWARVPWALGMLDELDGRREHAVENYLRAFELGDRSPELVRRTLHILQTLHRFDVAEELIHRWEQLPNTPILPEINRMAAEISIERQDPQQALLRAKRAVSRNSSDYQDHLWLARIHRASGDHGEAEAELKSAVNLAPQQGETWVALIQFLQLQQRLPEAEAILDRVRAEVPLEGQSAVLAVCYDALNKPAEAEEEFLRAVVAAPDNRLLLAEAAEFFRRHQKSTDAERLWRQLLSLCVESSKIERCGARRGLASTLAFRGDYPAFREALALVEQNLKELPKSTTDLRAKSTLLAMRGDPDQRRESVDLFAKLAREQPLSSQDQSLLAAIHELNGDLTRAHELWQALVSSQSNNQVYLARYISVLLKRHALSDAKVWMERLQSIAPDWQPTLELQAEFWLQEGKAKEVIDLFQQHIELPKEPEMRTQRLVESAEALERLAGSLLRQDAERRELLLQASEKLFREYHQRNPEKPQILAGFLARHDQLEQSLDLFDQAWDVVPPELVSSVLAGSLPQSEVSPGLLSRAIASISAHLPATPPTSMLNDLAALAELQQNFDQAQTYYQVVLNREPDNVVALNNLAFLLALQNRNLPEASQLLEKALAVSGPSPALLDTRAQIALAGGDLDSARIDRESVVKESPLPAAWFRLAIVYHLQKNPVKTREAAAKARDGGLLPRDLHFLERRHLDVILKSLDQET